MAIKKTGKKTIDFSLFQLVRKKVSLIFVIMGMVIERVFVELRDVFSLNAVGKAVGLI